jgi:glycosyltransferase involved in cell wall biosynthesis
MSQSSAKHIVIDARIRPSSTGRYIDQLLEHLQSIDHDNRYTVLLDPKDDWQPTASNFTAVACKYKRFTFNFLEQLTYGRFLKSLRPDLVHFGQTPQEPFFYFGRRVTTTHDLTMLRYARPGRFPVWVHWVRMLGYRLTFWLSHRQAKRIIVPSQFVADDLARLHPFTKNKTAVTLESAEPPLTIKPTALHGVTKPFIFHVGSPFPHKNIERLVEAFEKLAANQPDLQLVLAGKKEHYFEQLQKQIDTSPAKDRIVVPGFISDAELKWLYENAQAYVLPSLSEGFGLPGLEAMAHDCPLVSSNSTCLPEIYGEAAIYFDPYDAEAMAQSINKVISDEDLRQNLVAKGREQIKRYSWRRMAEETLAIYKSVL